MDSLKRQFLIPLATESNCHSRNNAKGVRQFQPRVGAQRQPWGMLKNAFNPERG
jgi:hypothetical protein